ncbi:MAG: hypothetical protein IJA86_07090 [Clostridia bacterium]|nr:hypothetical protein [Clostridia bacterium]
MTGLWITLGIFLFFVFLFSVPFHVTVSLQESVSVMARVLFLKIPIFPRPKSTKKKPKNKKQADQKTKKEKKPKKDKKQKKEKNKKEENGDEQKKKPKKKIDIVFWVRLLLDVVTALFKKLGRNFKIRVHAYEICVASEDAAKTAVMYGTVQTLSETLFLRLEKAINFKIVKNAPFGVYVNFLEEKSKANVKIDFSISLGGIFGIVFGVIFAFIRSFVTLSIKKNG